MLVYSLSTSSPPVHRSPSLKTVRIGEDSPLGLDQWFVAIWAVANCKPGITSRELARAIGVNQKSAWYMLHRIQAALVLAREGLERRDADG